MISTEDRKELKQELGNNYSSEVLKILKTKEAINKHGKPYSKTSVRRVFNGYDENIDIELAVYQHRDDIRNKKAALQKARAASHS